MRYPTPDACDRGPASIAATCRGSERRISWGNRGSRGETRTDTFHPRSRANKPRNGAARPLATASASSGGAWIERDPALASIPDRDDRSPEVRAARSYPRVVVHGELAAGLEFRAPHPARSQHRALLEQALERGSQGPSRRCAQQRPADLGDPGPGRKDVLGVHGDGADEAAGAVHANDKRLWRT